MKEATLSLTHPIIFVMDFDNPSAEIPEYSGEIVTSSPSCVSVRAIVDVDGDTTVRLITSNQEEPPEDFTYVFERSILTPSRKIAVATSENMKILESHVDGVSTSLRISINRTDFPDSIFVEVRSMW